MDTTGEVVLLHEVASLECPAMIRVCGLVTYVDLPRMLCELSDPHAERVSIVHQRVPSPHDPSSSSTKNVVESIGRMNSDTKFQSRSSTLLVKCDRVGVSGADLNTLKTFVGVLHNETISLDETNPEDTNSSNFVVNSETTAKTDPPQTASSPSPASARPSESVGISVPSKCPIRVLTALAAMSSEGLDYSLYHRVVMKRRQFLQPK